MTSGDLLTIAGMLGAQLVLMAALVWAVTKLLLGRIDRVETRIDGRLDDLGKDVHTGHLEVVGDLKHLTGRIDEFLSRQHPEPRSAEG
jgi:hypothetical protein